MELNAVTKSVNEVFSVNRKYLVPRFQREYSWTQEEIEEFWDDVSGQISQKQDGSISNEEYFIGCIVLVGEDTKFEHLIVDGQQRLTTLTILLRALVNRFSALKETAAADALHANLIEGIDNDGKKYFKLVNETPKPYFQNELQAKKPAGLNTAETEEEKLLQGAFDYFQKQVAAYKLADANEIESLRALRDQVLQYLKFILVTAKSEEDAYTIFETLNARGLSLSSVDLIKNWIFKNYQDTHPNDNAKEIWGKTRKLLSDFTDLDTFFRHYWNSKYSFASDDRLYKSFKDSVKAGRVVSAKAFLLELQKAADNYRLIGAPIEQDWKVQKEKAVYRSFVLLNQYKVTQIRPFLMALLECRERKIVDQTVFINSVVNLERFHFLFSTLCQDRASGLEGKYTRAAKNLHAAGADKAKVKKAIADLMKYLESRRPNATRIGEALGRLSYTTSKKTIQTVFSKVESGFLQTNELVVADFSLEHIADQADLQSWGDGIGNLLPLSEKLNNEIKAGSSFTTKKLVYKQSQYRLVDKYLNLYKTNTTWTEADATSWLKYLGGEIDTHTKLLPS